MLFQTLPPENVRPCEVKPTVQRNENGIPFQLHIEQLMQQTLQGTGRLHNISDYVCNAGLGGRRQAAAFLKLKDEVIQADVSLD